MSDPNIGRRVHVGAKMAYAGRDAVDKYTGTFLGFSMDFQDLFKGGAGQYPVGLVEMGDGRVDVVPTFRMRFEPR